MRYIHGAKAMASVRWTRQRLAIVLLRGRSMQNVRLGKTGPLVSELGLGCMGMSPGIYGATDDNESIATIRAAIDAGVTLLDTGDFYGMGHNEMLIGDALADLRREEVLISVKFGAQRGP